MYNGQSVSNPVLSSISEMVDTPIIKALDNEYENIVKSTSSGFPLEVFNPIIRELITELEKKNNYPKEISSGAILSASSTAIGGQYKLRMKSTWEEMCNLYIVLIAKPGDNKSHPMSFAYQPINDREDIRYEQYKLEMAQYNEQIHEKEEIGRKKPIYKSSILDDFTPEALADSLATNQKGVAIVVDELSGWLKNFNRYSSGSEEEMYLSFWSGKSKSFDRSTKESKRIKSPFVNVIGTVQPDLIENFSKGDKSKNGFIIRMLFEILKKRISNKWKDPDIDGAHVDNYKKMIDTLMDMDQLNPKHIDSQSTILFLDKEAKNLLYRWQNEEEERLTNRDIDYEIEVFRKIQTYAIRFCIILHLQDMACNVEFKDLISVDIVKRAIILAEHYRITFLEVRDSIENPDPIKGLSEEKKKTILSLPEYFKTSEGVEIAISNGMTEITFKRLLSDKKIFKRVKQGHYQKLA